VPQSSQPPKWIKPQLTRLVDEAPTGSDWLHEIKYDGDRMHAWLSIISGSYSGWGFSRP
jgi:bifunctional non-homologous end joining protein LigD